MKRTSSVLLAVVVIGALSACMTDNNSVEVVLDEFSIALPDEVMAGTVAFQVQNAGDMEHTFGVFSPGFGRGSELAAALDPGGSAVFTVELQPGTYTVYCPIGGHRGQGMEATVRVVEATASGQGAPLGEEGVQASEGQAPITDDYSAP